MRLHTSLGALCALAAAVHGGTMYAVDSGRVLYTLDLTTGTATVVGNVTPNAGTTAALARDPTTGTVYLASTSLDELFTLDLSTGTATSVGSFGNSAIVMHGLEFDCDGNLWGGSNADLFSIDKATGAAVQIGDTGQALYLNLAYVPGTGTMYGTNSSADSSYTVDLTTGSVTLLGPLGAGSTSPNGLAWNQDDGKLYMVDNGTPDRLFTIDLVTGAATLVGPTGTGNLLGLQYISDTISNPCLLATPYCFGDGSGTPCPCTPVPLVGDADKGCPNGFNAGGGKLTASGTASIGADTLLMTCTTINNGGAVVFQGTNDNGGGLGTAFGDGLRCAGGTVRRMRSHSVTTNSHQYPDPMFADNAISIRGAVLAPGDRWYQGWYRSGLAHCDPTQNYNLTNGVKITWGP